MARTTNKFTRFVRQASSFVGVALARGVALFVGVYSLMSAVSALRSSRPTQNLWWIDPGFLPDAAGLAIVTLCAAVLLAYGLAPRMSTWRRWATVLACVALAAIALQNTSAFYIAWGAQTFWPGVMIPFSLVIAVVFALLGWAVFAQNAAKPKLAEHVGALVALLLVIVLFPLAQIGFFGTSDYRAKADAAVVFGALVYDSGQPSPSLRDRVDTAVGLYKAGLVRRLVMSGGVEPNGFDETAVMRDAAIKLGVSAADILRDPKGDNTDATVTNTTAIFKREGIHRVIAVSQFYHLPRIKLAYLAAGWDVRTVPAREQETIWKTPLFVAREVPGFWVYWLRAFVRDIRGG